MTSLPLEPKLLDPFVTAALETVKTMAGVDCEAGAPHVKKDHDVYGVITGFIGLTGKEVVGNLVLSFDKECILFLCEKILFETLTAVNQDVADLTGEITNIVCGVAKQKLSEIGIEIGMSTPSVFIGDRIQLTQIGTTELVAVPCSCTAGAFMVEVHLDPVQPKDPVQQK